VSLYKTLLFYKVQSTVLEVYELHPMRTARAGVY